MTSIPLNMTSIPLNMTSISSLMDIENILASECPHIVHDSLSAKSNMQRERERERARARESERERERVREVSATGPVISDIQH